MYIYNNAKLLIPLWFDYFHDLNTSSTADYLRDFLSSIQSCCKQQGSHPPLPLLSVSVNLPPSG